MGTRADFYVGRGEQAEWLGSIAWDGYPAGIDKAVFDAAGETAYRTAVLNFLNREDGTLPEMGWPWPWDDSNTTDYAYAFDGGRVYGSSFGAPWFLVDLADDYSGEPQDEDYGNDIAATPFPNMSARRNMPPLGGNRSGTIVVNGPTVMSPMSDLAAALHATITDHYGDVRINLHDGGHIYCGIRGTVKLDHRGHVHNLGTWDAGTDALVKAYRAAVAEAVAS